MLDSYIHIIIDIKPNMSVIVNQV